MSSVTINLTSADKAKLNKFGAWSVAIALFGSGYFVGWKPSLTIMVAKRPSLFGSGFVLHIDNQTGNQLSVVMRVTGKNRPQSFERVFTIPPNGSTEIGWAEGWDFQYGDKVTFSHPKYASETWNLREE